MNRIAIRSRLSPEQARDVVRELIRPEGFLGGLSYAPNDRRPFIGPHLSVALFAPVLFGMLGFDAVKELHEFVQAPGARGGYGLLVFLPILRRLRHRQLYTVRSSPGPWCGPQPCAA